MSFGAWFVRLNEIIKVRMAFPRQGNERLLIIHGNDGKVKDVMAVRISTEGR